MIYTNKLMLRITVLVLLVVSGMLMVSGISKGALPPIASAVGFMAIALYLSITARKK